MFIETLFGETYAKQLKDIPLLNDTIYRRISNISAVIHEQLESELIRKLFPIQLDDHIIV